MTVHIHVRDLPVTQIRFHYSVLHEVLISLHVLEDYRSYPLHVNWSIKTLRKLPREVNREREYFQVVIATLIFWLWKADGTGISSFAEELQTFEELPLDAFTTPIISRLVLGEPPSKKTVVDEELQLEEFYLDPIVQEDARLWLKTYFPKSVNLVDDLLTDAQAVKQRFVQLLQDYWDHHFDDFWTVYEPHFVADIENKGKQLMTKGVLKVIESISPKMTIDERRHLASYVAAGDRELFTLQEHDALTLHPSFFTYPLIVFTIRKENEQHTDLSITYPMEAVYEISSAPVMAEELIQILQGVSDPTRLQILQLVAQMPRSTKEIAEILNLTNSAISKHLQILKSAGWVTSERDSYYVMYRATSTPLPILNRGLEDILNT